MTPEEKMNELGLVLSKPLVLPWSDTAIPVDTCC